MAAFCTKSSKHMMGTVTTIHVSERINYMEARDLILVMRGRLSAFDPVRQLRTHAKKGGGKLSP